MTTLNKDPELSVKHPGSWERNINGWMETRTIDKYVPNSQKSYTCSFLGQASFPPTTACYRYAHAHDIQ